MFWLNMKNNQNISLLFWHRKSKQDKNGYAPIICRISIKGVPKAEISTGKKAHFDEWDLENQKAKGKDKETKEINFKISELTVDLNRHFILLQGRYEKITALMLKNVYLGKPAKQLKVVNKNEKLIEKKSSIPTLLQTVDTHITNFEKMVEKGLRSKETLKQWNSTRTKLQEFLPFRYGAFDMNLDKITYPFAFDFYLYLTTEQKKVIRDAAAKNHIKKTKGILNFAERSQWINKNPLLQFKCGTEENEIEPLEIVQVEKIWRKKIPIRRLAEVRDAFIFQCFTGFAFQDVYALTPGNITMVGIARERWLIKNRGKTGIIEMVPIMPIVEEILLRYENHLCRTEHGRLIPVNSNYRYNCYLKELATICGINRDLNTHLARHTFADIMLNILEFSLAEVSRMLGHKTIRTTQRYARVRKQLISKTYANRKEVLFTKDGQLRRIGLSIL
ncbi:MAG: integrase [Mucilaginibacter sp.]|nr:integrase [Mucilaginibacter sp.]